MIIAVPRSGGVVLLNEREVFWLREVFAKCGRSNIVGQEVIVFWFDVPEICFVRRSPMTVCLVQFTYHLLIGTSWPSRAAR